MGLYISISSSGEEAIRQDPDLKVEYFIHEEIFLGPPSLRDIKKWSDGSETKNYYYPQESERRAWMSQYPLFYRMEDGHSDHIYHQSEIAALNEELAEIKTRAQEPNLLKFVEQMMDVCEKALKRGQKIFCFGD